MSQDDPARRVSSRRDENGVQQKSTAYNGDGTTMTLRPHTLTGVLMAAVLLTGCGDPKFEQAGSRNSGAEDRQACAVEVANSRAAKAYWQNPAAHRDFPNEALANMIHCTKRERWKEVVAEGNSR